MTRAVRPRTLRRIASRERQRGYLGLNSYRRLAASALSGPVFFSQLTTSLVPDKAAPGTAPTFTRATTKTFTDWEGVLRTAIAGEACFTGARRMQNFVPDIGSWITGSNITVTSGVADPVGGNTAFTFTATAGGGSAFRQIGTTIAAGRSVRNTMWIRARSAAPVVHMYNGTDATTRTVVTSAVTSAWQRIDGGLQTAASGSAIGILLPNNGDSIDVWQPQSEDVTGQSNQNPGEFVSKGLLSAPYQGANVDGVQYFATQNGNTVAANVVTAGTGAAIPLTTLLGYSAWQASTNLALQSTFAATWVAAQATLTAATTVSPDGSSNAATIKEDATVTALHAISEAATQAANIQSTFSVFVKRGTGTRHLALVVQSGADYFRTYFDLGTGAVGSHDVGGTGVWSSASVKVQGSYFLCTMTGTPSTTVANPTLGVRMSSSTAVGGDAYSGDNASTLILYGAQYEAGSFATPYIATTTAAVTRNADVLQSPSAGNVLGTAGACYAEVASANLVNGARMVSVDGATNTFRALLEDSGGALGVYDGTTNRAFLGIAPSAAAQKFATSWGAATCNGAAAGVLGTAQAFDGDFNVDTNITIGTFANLGGLALNGNIRNVKIWNRALADAELVQATS